LRPFFINDPYFNGKNHAYKKRPWLIKLVQKRHSAGLSN
jgi:hypothetical protein